MAVSWKQRFAELYNEVAETEPEEESQLDEVLNKFEDWYFDAASMPKATLHCSVCGSADTTHLALVLEKGRCNANVAQIEV